MRLKQVEPKIEDVGGRKFYITPFPAFKSANISGELAKVLVPFLTSLASGIKTDGNNTEDVKNGLFDIDVDTAISALGTSIGIDGEMVEKLMKKLLIGGHIVVELEDENGDIQHERLDVDLANEIFCGDVQDMFILCYYVIRLNFNGFFKKLTNLSGNQRLVAPLVQRPTI